MESKMLEKAPKEMRKEKRKAARLEKLKKRYSSWTEHQKASKLKRIETKTKQKIEEKPEVLVYEVPGKREIERNSDVVKDGEIEEKAIPKKLKVKKEGKIEEKAIPKKLKVKKKEEKKSLKRKTKFEEYLEMDMNKNMVSAEEDLRMERKLAKKLKVKNGKLRGLDDEMNLLFEEIPSMLEEEKAVDDEEEGKSVKEERSLVEEKEQSELDEEDSEADESDGVAEEVETLEEPRTKVPKTENVKYVAPHLRSRTRNESEEHAQIRRRIRGLLNRLSESNVESLTVELSTIYKSIGRSSGSQIVSEEVLTSCSGGPRGNEQYAAVFAAFVAGMACSVGMDFSAKLIASLAKSFEDEYMKEDNLSLRNLTLLLSYLCIFGVCSSDLIYDFLNILSKRLTEIDVSTILTVLQCCGMKLRGDDPSAMKDFILSVQNRVNELKSPSESMPEDQLKINSKRMEFMLETIFDIKNNKKKAKDDPAHHTRIKNWLQKLRVEDISLHGLKWSKLLDPNKNGQWWLPGDIASALDNAEEVASTIDREVLEAQKLLELAAAQRMNTDARRAIFCIIMSGEDYIDAFEKLLRLDLPGKQDREIMRVLLKCCLQEKVFNKYYTVLATKLCSHDKNHKFTLQYCLWDHYKELESMELIRSMNLAKFTAEMIASFSLSLAVLKTVNFSDLKHLTPKRVMHFRMLFEAMFEQPEATVWNIFTRIAITSELETLRNGLEFFIKQYVVSTNKNFSKKFKVARKAFSNIEGVLL